MWKTAVERLEQEMDETADYMPTVTVSRRDLQELIERYKQLTEKLKNTER